MPRLPELAEYKKTALWSGFFTPSNNAVLSGELHWPWRVDACRTSLF